MDIIILCPLGFIGCRPIGHFTRWEIRLFNLHSPSQNTENDHINPLSANYVYSCVQPILFVLKTRTFNPFKPEFTIVIFIHYKPRIAVAILDL